MQPLELTDVQLQGEQVQIAAIIRGGWRKALAQLMDDLFPGEMYAYAIKGNELNVTIK
jgi:hypothetical protein